MRFRVIQLAGLAAALCALQGCIAYGNNRVTHDPPLAEFAARIQEGETTGAEILIWLGDPDIRADGAEITHYPESTMGKYRAEVRESLIEAKENLRKYEGKRGMGNMPSASDIDPDYLEKVARAQPYSSIDDEHIALLYLEHEYTTRGGALVLPVMVGGSKTVVRMNRLLILIDKNTDIVEDFSYREEFNAD